MLEYKFFKDKSKKTKSVKKQISKKTKTVASFTLPAQRHPLPLLKVMGNSSRKIQLGKSWGWSREGKLSSGSAGEAEPGASWAWQEQEEEYTEMRKEKTRKAVGLVPGRD